MNNTKKQNGVQTEKIAIVTGASTGIGKTVAKQLAKTGYRVILVARSSDKLAQVTKEIEAEGGKADYYRIDLADELNIKGFLNEIEDNVKTGNYPKIDALVNIAGVWHDQTQVLANTDFETFSPETIQNTYAVGFIAPTLLVHGLIPFMKKGSHIINLSGTFENGAKGWLPYYASKKGLEALTYGLAEELKDKGIFVNGISPSDTSTEEYKKWFPQYINEALNPEKIAELVSKFLVSTQTGTIQVIKKYEYSKLDKNFLKSAIEMSKQSYMEGAFPAGAVIVKEGKVVAKTTSSQYPQINFHSESKAIDLTISKDNKQLTECTLFASMEPCLMCLSRAYWAGIRRIVFAIKKESVPYALCYESNSNHYELMEKFNQKIQLVHIEELENEAMKNVNEWIKENT